MSVFSALWRLIKKLFTKIASIIGGIVKKYWPLLLIGAAIWFAPQIATWLAANGAPTWVTSGFAAIATNLTPTLVSAATWMTAGAAGLLSSAWASYVNAGIGYQLAIAAGVAAAVAPDEFAAVVSEVGDVVSDVVDTVVDVVGDAAGSLLSSPLGLAAGAAGLWLLLSSDKDKKVEVTNAQAA